MALFYKLDPDVVYNWTGPRFMDRQELMFMMNYEQPKNHEDSQPREGWKEYTGPKR